MNTISREEAALSGFGRYFTGIPCVHGHIAERYVVNTKCLGCIPKFPKLPKKLGTVKARNMFWALTPFQFDLSFESLSPEEMQAAINYVQKAGWHNAALEAVRKK